MGKKKIVLDTNILISAFGWDGKPREILRKVINQEFELILSQQQIIEIRRVLDYPKFTFENDQKTSFLTFLCAIAFIIDVPNTLRIIKEDPEDNIILETALIGNALYIITGDYHLLKLKEFRGTKIITAAEFLTEFFTPE